MSFALAAFAGVLNFLGFVGFGIFPLAFIAWVPVLIAVRKLSPKRTFAVGILFGTISHIGGYYWVGEMLQNFAGMNLPVAYAGMILLCTYQGLAFALLLVLVRLAERDLGLAPIWALAIAYPAMEWLFPLLFPYYIGNSQYRFVAITQIVELTGMLGLTVLIAMVNGAFYELAVSRLEQRKLIVPRLAAAGALFAVFLFYGLIRLSMIDSAVHDARKIKVAMIQTNLGARDKAERRALFISRHQEMTRAAAAAHPEVDLFVWPETAYNTRIPRAETNVYHRVMEGVNKPMIFGALTVEDNPEGGKNVYNSAVMTSSTGEVLGRFDKVELLAFGEYVPFAKEYPALKKMVPRSTTFARGESFDNLSFGENSFLPMICYEDILPAFVRKLWKEAGPADVLINITNDSWYGDSHEPWIHLVLSTFRSIETRRALIRATNTGVSAFVDPAGRITAHTGQWTQETLIGDVPLIEDGSTTLYQRTGDWLGPLSLAGITLGFIQRRKKLKSSVSTPSS
jgi:apolipoprotein N-acyltransferase